METLVGDFPGPEGPGARTTLSPERHLEPGRDPLPGGSLDLVLPLDTSHGSTPRSLPGSAAKTQDTDPSPFLSKGQIMVSKCYPPWRTRRVGKLRLRTYARFPNSEGEA
jgi:hypothetical protein